MTKLNVKNLDHLGIIAAIVDELGLVDYINEQLQENDRAKISAGLVVSNRSERVNSYGGNREGGVVPLRLALTASVINSKTSRF